MGATDRGEKMGVIYGCLLLPPLMLLLLVVVQGNK